MGIQEMVRQEYIHARNTEQHAERLEKKIYKEIEGAWTDIALYANQCGLRGEEYMRFVKYGARTLGFKVHEDEYLRLREIGVHI